MTSSLAAARNLIPVETIPYDRNEEASYCRLDPLLFDTIVFHHTQTTSTTTAKEINQMHLNRGSPNDPWLMIGYHYVINASYERGPRVNIRVTQGRELSIAGSHAGSLAFSQISPDVRASLESDNSVLCGKRNAPLQIPGDKFNSQGLAKTNYHTIAVAIIGNYAPRNRDNPGGYPPSNPRYPSLDTIEASARLACQLQMKMPRIKKLSFHGFYRPTSCPGLIEERLRQIRDKVKEYGCVFQ